MQKFSEKSQQQLFTCHEDLQIIFNEVIKYRDCSVIEGFRNEKKQNDLKSRGLTQLSYPNSKHNSIPSRAVDVVPFLRGKAVFGDTLVEQEEMCYFAGFVLGCAKMLLLDGKITHELTWGGDWNGNSEIKDTKFRDYPHFELKE